jgi:hypothetical protein
MRIAGRSLTIVIAAALVSTPAPAAAQVRVAAVATVADARGAPVPQRLEREGGRFVVAADFGWLCGAPNVRFELGAAAARVGAAVHWTF